MSKLTSETKYTHLIGPENRNLARINFQLIIIWKSGSGAVPIEAPLGVLWLSSGGILSKPATGHARSCKALSHLPDKLDVICSRYIAVNDIISASRIISGTLPGLRRWAEMVSECAEPHSARVCSEVAGNTLTFTGYMCFTSKNMWLTSSSGDLLVVWAYMINFSDPGFRFYRFKKCQKSGIDVVSHQKVSGPCCSLCNTARWAGFLTVADSSFRQRRSAREFIVLCWLWHTTIKGG